MTELVFFVTTLVMFSAMMSLFEVSVFSCSPVKLATLVEKHKHLKLLSTHSKQISSAILVTNICVDVVGASLAGTMAYKLFGSTIEYTIYTLAVTFALLMFSTLIPKLYASSHASTVLRFCGRIIIAIYWITKPIVSILYWFVKPFTKGDAGTEITQSEINSMIAFAETNKVITDKQSSLISNVLSMSKEKVYDLLPKKSKIDSVSVNSLVSDFEDTILRCGRHKRYVVTHTHGGKEQPVGIVLYRDMIKVHLDGKSKETRITDIMHHASITFSDDPAISLIEKLDRNSDHITVVVDRTQKMLGVIQSDDIIRHFIK